MEKILKGIKFQFYLSSIKSKYRFMEIQEIKMFQFYLSSIKSRRSIVFTNRFSRVSILP